jgi:chemotaxis protein MotB
MTIPKDASGGDKEGWRGREASRSRGLQKLKMLMQKMAADPKLAQMLARISASPRRARGCASIWSTRPISRCSHRARTSFRARGARADEAGRRGDRCAAQFGDRARPHRCAALCAGARSTIGRCRRHGPNATRKALADFGVRAAAFARIEGVADREPFIPTDPYDPRNRRMSITLAWSAAEGGDGKASPPASHGSVDLMAANGAHDPTAMPAEALAQIEAKKARK